MVSKDLCKFRKMETLAGRRSLEGRVELSIALKAQIRNGVSRGANVL